MMVPLTLPTPSTGSSSGLQMIPTRSPVMSGGTVTSEFHPTDLAPAEDQGRFRSMYGVMFGTKNDDGTFDIAYAIYRLQFRLADDPNQITSGELVAIKEYTKHQ